MRYKRATKALLVGAAGALSLFLSVEALACGESLFRVGKGVAYRAQTAPLPGNVLMVAPTEAAKGLAERLSAAGHRVRVVEDASFLAQELRSGEYEVVLAAFNSREVVAAQTASAASTATYVPITLEASEEALADELYERSVASSDNFTQFLKIIHRTLKKRA